MRIVLLVVVAFCVAGLATWQIGRPTRAESADGPVVIDYWEKWTGIEAAAMQGVVDDFNKSQHRIFVRMLGTSAIDQKLMLAISAGRPPDVAGLWSHTVNVYAEKGALLPLDRMAANAGVRREDYVPVLWELCSHKGFLWALPTVPSSLAMHWNRAAFRNAGLDPDRPPLSIAELDDIAEKLTVVNVVENGRTVQKRFTELTPAQRDSHAFEIVRLGFSPGIPGFWNPMWGTWFGGRLWDGKRAITSDAPANVAAFEWFQSYVRKYGVDNLRAFASSFGNFASPQDPFLSGKVAIVLQGVWMQNFIEKYAPKLDWDAAAFPSIDPKRLGDTTIVESDVLVIPKGSAHPREAFEFARFVNRQAEAEKLAIGQRKTSPLAKVSADFYDRHPNPHARLFAKLIQSPNAVYVPRCAVWNEYSDEMTAAVDRISSLSSSPAEALAEVRQRMQWKLDRVNRRWDAVGAARVDEWREEVGQQGARP